MKDPRRGSRRPEPAAAPGDQAGAPAGSASRLAALDDADTPLYSVGQAAEALGTRPAALRRLDAAGVLTPGRSGGGQRRYTRRQLERAGRIQEYVADGASASLAGHIVSLEDEVRDLREQLRQARQAPGGQAPDGGRAHPGGRRLPGPRASSD